jgi:DedD protein
VLKSLRLANHTHDDGFHEIQLNGKQLVFLFMAATVVSVVIFLCGVLVGRGVRAERGGAAEVAASDAPAADLTPAPQQAVTPPPAEADPTKAAPPPEVDDLTYFKRLEQKTGPAEKLAPAPRGSQAASAPQAPASKDRGAPSSRQAEPAKQEPASVPSRAPGPGFAVQVAALNVRSEADAIARRLAGKGYAAYVLAPANGTPSVFRVRVGSFKTRREAESVAAKLQREEQFKPWVTR